MRLKLSRWIALSLFIAAGTGIAYGQQPPETLPFFGSDQAFDPHGVDNVNLFNGDIGVSIPLGPEYTLGPTGLPFQLRANASAKFWHFSKATCPGGSATQFAWIAGDPTLGVGWTLQLGYVAKRSSTVWEYYAPGGGAYQADLSVGNSGVTKDGSHIRITALPNITSPTSYTVELPDGTIQTFNHTYTIGGTGSPDFNNNDYGQASPTRFGLGTIKDRFGNVLVTVNWPGTGSSEASGIALNPFTGAATAIAFTWTTFPVGGFNWRVLDSITFPAPGAKHLQVDFDYVTASFDRNAFDNSAAGACATPALVKVPELQKITFSDPAAVDSMLAFDYEFTYFGSPTGTVEYQGAIKKITLPTLGTIEYDYSITAGAPCKINICDPESLVEQELNNPENPQPPVTIYVDKSPGVASRKEFDPFTNRTVQTDYLRSQYVGLEDPTTVDYNRLFRRTTVTGPGNDVGAGAARYARRYYFHVDNPETQKNASGIELLRLYYADDNVAGAPVRSIIKCYGGQCGYQTSSDGSGLVWEYDMSAGRTPADAMVTWYGSVPASQDGGDCTGTTKCTAVINSNYNGTAGKYDTTTLTSTLPPGTGNPNPTSRTIETTWDPATAAGHWLLDLYDSRFVWDGASMPGGSDGSSIARQYFAFDSTTGFLNGTWTWDSSLGKAIQNCNYKNANGTPLNDFSQTYSSPGEPIASPCPGSSSSVTDPNNGDMFGQAYTAGTDLLPKTANWRKGAGSIGWNSLEVVRDGATGYVIDSKEPNSTLKTTYTYDSLGRVIMVQPPGGSSAEWPTTFCYLPGAGVYTDFVIIKKIMASPVLTLGANDANGICKRDDGTPAAGSGVILGYQYDGLGRVVREMRRHQKLIAGGYFVVRDRRYDSAGHLIYLSDWQGCGASAGASNFGSCALQSVNPLTAPPASTTYSNFDPFGRVQAVDGPGGASDITISRTDGSILFSDSIEQVTIGCVNAVAPGCSGGISSQTTTQFDALGRAIKVTEPGSDITNYTYNVLDKLTSVDQGSADRTFAWSAFGFLKSAQTPENGTTGGATTSYSLYGSLGNLRTKTDGSPTSTTYDYSYDAAARVTRVQAAGLDYVVNCYDGSGSCVDGTTNYAGGTYPKAKLTRRLGWNYVPYESVPVYDDFNYSATTGRLSSQITSLGTLGKPGFGAPVTESWTYNTLGLPATHAHPRASGAPTSMTDQNEFTSGFLTKVTGAYQSGSLQLVTSNYGAAGGLSDYKTNPSGTFVTTTITPDTLVPSRPGRFQAGALFDTGAYGYDGAGNIKSMGSDSFRYDARSRLTSAKYAGQPTSCTDSVAMSQCFTYDRNNNLTAKSGVNPTTLSVSASTNHLTGGIYDDRGNLTAFGTETMGFDLLNRQYRNVNIQAPATDFIYFYDGAGERIGKLDKTAAAQRREMARDIVEARGDTVPNCTNTGFTDATCAGNPNDGKYIEKIQKAGIVGGCGTGLFCPDASTLRQQAAVFFVKGKYCPLNGTSGSCTLTPAQLPPCTGVFSDVPCPSLFADYIEKLYNDGVTVGCGVGLYCPTDTLTTWQMAAWMQKYWPAYNPVPRATIVTLRDGAQLTTEALAVPATGDASAVFTYQRDNVYLGGQLISGAIWSGTTPGWHFYTSDHLGTPRLVTNTAGAEIEERKLWPYGDDAPGTGGGAGQRLKLALMERDDESTHLYDHARSTGYTIGRFLSMDPVAGNVRNPQSWNRYSYTLGNPMNLIDPLGLEDAVPCGTTDPGSVPCGSYTTGITVTGYWYFPWFPSYGPIGDAYRGGTGGRGSLASLPRRIKETVCSAVPEGRTEGLAGGLGGVGAAVGSVEYVTNYNTRTASIFTSQGLAVGWNGVAQATAFSGFIYGLGMDNSSYSEGFTTLSLGAGPVGVFHAASNGGVSTPGGLMPSTQVQATGLSIGANLTGSPVTGSLSFTHYQEVARFDNPPMGLFDNAMSLVRQACNE